MRKVFLDELPKRGKKQIDWTNSIGYKIKFIYEDIEGDIEIVDYFSKPHILKIKYLDKYFEILTNNITKGAIGIVIGEKTGDFKIETGTHFENDKRNLVIIDRKYIKNKNGKSYKHYKYKCNICGFECDEHYKNGKLIKELWMEESNLLQGKGCACCSKPQKIAVTGINDVTIIAPQVVKYFQGGHDEAKKYTTGSGQKIYPICPDCGRVKKKQMEIKTIINENTIRCSCQDGLSYPNKFMFSILEQLKIEFETEYSPDWIKPRRYDFYFELNNKKYIVEMDGALGHGKNVHKLSKQTAEESQEIDDYKDKMALKYGIEVIRVNCEKSELEYVKTNIINSKLNDILVLKFVNWDECEAYARGNLLKYVCDIWNNVIKDTSEIEKITKLSLSTVLKYLKIGNKLKLCDYNKKISNINHSNKTKGSKNARAKKIINLETKEIFGSITEANNKYKCSGAIWCCLNRVTQSACGYHWMFYDEYINADKKHIESTLNNKIIIHKKKIINITTGEIFESINEAKKQYGYKVSECLRGTISTCNGYKFMYYENYKNITKD